MKRISWDKFNAYLTNTKHIPTRCWWVVDREQHCRFIEVENWKTSESTLIEIPDEYNISPPDNIKVSIIERFEGEIRGVDKQKEMVNSVVTIDRCAMINNFEIVIFMKGEPKHLYKILDQKDMRSKGKTGNDKNISDISSLADSILKSTKAPVKKDGSHTYIPIEDDRERISHISVFDRLRTVDIEIGKIFAVVRVEDILTDRRALELDVVYHSINNNIKLWMRRRLEKTKNTLMKSVQMIEKRIAFIDSDYDTRSENIKNLREKLCQLEEVRMSTKDKEKIESIDSVRQKIITMIREMESEHYESIDNVSSLTEIVSIIDEHYYSQFEN
jgi:hypothetical protein